MVDELGDNIAYAVLEELSVSKWSDCGTTPTAAEFCSVWDEILVKRV